jgi:predicted RNA-binding protein
MRTINLDDQTEVVEKLITKEKKALLDMSPRSARRTKMILDQFEVQSNHLAESRSIFEVLSGQTIERFMDSMRKFKREGIDPINFNEYKRMTKFMSYTFEKHIEVSSDAAT